MDIEMKIAIRMDDITPDMDWAKFLRFKELCDLYQVKPLIGVVPYNQDEMLQIDTPREDFWEYIQELQKNGWMIAQHGYCHIYSTKKMGLFPLNQISEFAGISYENQLQTLKKGKEILESKGIYTDIFMAPAHSYDKNTIRALKELGFRKITDGFGKQPYVWKAVQFYPISYKQSSSLKQSKGYTTFVVHTNTMDEADFERYDKLFREYQNRLIDYASYLQITPQKRGFCGHLKEYMMAVSKFILVKIKSI